MDIESPRPMPRYFFDVQDGDRLQMDDTGTEFPNADLAHHAAVLALGELAKDVLHRGSDQRTLIMRVREEQGRTVSDLTLSFEAKRH